MYCKLFSKIDFNLLSHLYLIYSFFTLLVTIFPIAFIKCSVHLYSTFYLLYFFHKFTFGFTYTYYLLTTLKNSSDHSVVEALQVFLLFVYVKRNTAHIKTFYIQSFTPV